MESSHFEDEPPTPDAVTDYDRSHLVAYLRLLAALKEGADWSEVAATVLDLDPDADEVRARRVYDAHIDRARWMTTRGYLHLRDGESG